MNQRLVVVRGGGDIATGTIYKLIKCGYQVLVLEVERPSAIRRKVAFCEAVYEGKWQVEDMTCYLARDYAQAQEIMNSGSPALLIDPQAEILKTVTPYALVDAILAKKNLGTTRSMCPVTVALGPGFCAGRDVDAVIETMRGHQLGRVIYEGEAIPNTGVPGAINGVSALRVIHAQADGILYNVHQVTDMVHAGEVLAEIETADGGRIPVTATIDGLLRGLIRDGYPVTKGFKIADIDPRISEYENCFTISDKARCIAGGVLEAIAFLGNQKNSDMDMTSEEEIYADYAATGIHKPQAVIEAVVRALEHPGNPGRGAHEMSLGAARQVHAARREVCRFFGAGERAQVVFTSGVTESLNLVIRGLFHPGDHVITTYMEHNSILRPLYDMQKHGIELCVCAPAPDAIMSAVRENTRAVVMTHGSNVTGEVYDIQAIGALCRKKGILLIADCAQTAGVMPISMEADGIDILCFTGHKGLMGPQGVGGICIREGISLRPLKSGGTGVHSFAKEQPAELPERLEAGTQNTPAICGLLAGIRYLEAVGLETIREKEQSDIRYFYEQIRELPEIRIYGDVTDFEHHTATLSLNLGEEDAADISRVLEERYHILTRAGAHCAPLAHEHYGTVVQGMVRFSFGYATTRAEIDRIVRALKEISA